MNGIKENAKAVEMFWAEMLDMNINLREVYSKFMV